MAGDGRAEVGHRSWRDERVASVVIGRTKPTPGKCQPARLVVDESSWVRVSTTITAESVTVGAESDRAAMGSLVRVFGQFYGSSA